MSDKTKGLHQKYAVERTDGKPLKGGCIVLEFGDPNARVGIRAFAQQVEKEGYQQLADDLYTQLMEFESWGL